MAETVIVQSSDFVSNSLQPIAGFDVDHLETQWQISVDISFHPVTIILDTWFQLFNLLSLEVVLDPGTYYFRNRHRDSYGIISEWSEPLLVELETPVFVPDDCSISTPVFQEESSGVVSAFVGEGCGHSPTFLHDDEGIFVQPRDCP